MPDETVQPLPREEFTVAETEYSLDDPDQVLAKLDEYSALQPNTVTRKELADMVRELMAMLEALRPLKVPEPIVQRVNRLLDELSIGSQQSVNATEVMERGEHDLAFLPERFRELEHSITGLQSVLSRLTSKEEDSRMPDSQLSSAFDCLQTEVATYLQAYFRDRSIALNSAAVTSTVAVLQKRLLQFASETDLVGDAQQLFAYDARTLLGSVLLEAHSGDDALDENRLLQESLDAVSVGEACIDSELALQLEQRLKKLQEQYNVRALFSLSHPETVLARLKAMEPADPNSISRQELLNTLDELIEIWELVEHGNTGLSFYLGGMERARKGKLIKLRETLLLDDKSPLYVSDSSISYEYEQHGHKWGLNDLQRFFELHINEHAGALLQSKANSLSAHFPVDDKIEYQKFVSLVPEIRSLFTLVATNLPPAGLASFDARLWNWQQAGCERHTYQDLAHTAQSLIRQLSLR